LSIVLSIGAEPLDKPLFERAKAILRQLKAAEDQLLRDRDLVFRKAWHLGEVLCQLKEKVGHGRWLLWLPANFPELGRNDERRIKNARRCINFYRENRQNSGTFDTDSVRKLMWGYVPAKERPQLEGNEAVNPAPHYLTFVNNFNKWHRQVRMGRIPMPPREQLRRELEPVVRDIIDLCSQDWVADLFR